MPADYHTANDLLCDRLAGDGIDVDVVKAALKAQAIETPSWGYADSGTRFGVFRQPGAAVTIWEKLADAGAVHRFTGVCPSVAVHVLWDFTPETPPDAVVACATEHGVRVGSINPNVFQDQEYKLGSIAHHDPRVRTKAITHMRDSIAFGQAVGSDVLSLWFADGTNYPGQQDIRKRKRWVQESLAEVYAALPPAMTMLVEYKFYEPAFYVTDIADWGMSYVFCKALGPQAKVLVDLGHHAMGVNIEHLVAFLLDERMLGGFHFNNRKYGDDDLTVGSVNPYELFLIFCELTGPLSTQHSALSTQKIEYMIDQAANLKLKIEDMIQTVMQIQTAYAKALIVPRGQLEDAQMDGDVTRAEQILVDAFQTDVRPLLQVVREELGLAPDPLCAYRASGYQQKIEAERGHRKGTGGLGQTG